MAKSNSSRWLINLAVFGFFLSATIALGLFASSADAAKTKVDTTAEASVQRASDANCTDLKKVCRSYPGDSGHNIVTKASDTATGNATFRFHL